MENQNCKDCGQPMADGELVQTDWAGNALAHIECPKPESQAASAGK